ncbi:MAG: MarC family protein [Candidatus Methanomethylophilaceae archaeon]
MEKAMIDLALWPVLTASDYLVFFVTLFTLFSPPAAIAAFATITDRFPPDIQKKVAKRLARNYFVVMLVSIIIGEYLLMVLGISTPALMLTGGLAVFIAGMPMMIYGQKLQFVKHEDEFQAVPRADWESVVSVPMTFPMTVGGATIAVAISTAHQTTALMDYAFLILVVAAMALIVYAVTLTASALSRRLGGSIDILVRASGIIIVAISIQILVSGLFGLVEIYG